MINQKRNRKFIVFKEYYKKLIKKLYKFIKEYKNTFKITLLIYKKELYQIL